MQQNTSPVLALFFSPRKIHTHLCTHTINPAPKSHIPFFSPFLPYVSLSLHRLLLSLRRPEDFPFFIVSLQAVHSVGIDLGH